jgi:hypothetical protein
MPNDPNITPEQAWKFIQEMFRRADDDDCMTGGQCPFYEDCDDETCVNIRKVLLNASDSSKEEVTP